MSMWVPMHRMPSFASKRRRVQDEDQMMPNGLLSQPNTEKIDTENIFVNGMEIGHAAMQGYRTNMEDQHAIEPFPECPDHVLVAIFDGHAGTGAAEYASTMLRSCVEECEAWKEYVKLSTKDRMLQCDTLLSKALCQAYLAIDEDLRDIDSMDSSGCTAVSCIISPSHIVCASVGDSRAVLGTRPGGISKKLSCVAMTEDHKPNNPEERKRIEDAGGFVMDDRVNGELAMSRALGDFRYKGNTEVSATEHAVICIPDICVQKRDKKGDEVLVLACDGVWDVISNEESVAYMASVVLPGQSLTSDLDEPVSCQEAAESLLDLSLHEGSTDNISAIVVKFNSHNTVSNGK